MFYHGDDIPILNIKRDLGLMVSNLRLKINLKCKHNKSDPIYYPVYTIITKKLSFTGAIFISDGFNIKIENMDFEFQIENITDSHIGEIKLGLLNKALSLMQKPVQNAVNLFFRKGVPMNWFLKMIDMDWIGLDNSKLEPYDGYFIFYVTPKWNVQKLMKNFKD